MKKYIVILSVISITFLFNSEAFSCIGYSENLKTQALLTNKASVKLDNKTREYSKCSRNKNKDCSSKLREIKKAQQEHEKQKSVYEDLKANPTDGICR